MITYILKCAWDFIFACNLRNTKTVVRMLVSEQQKYTLMRTVGEKNTEICFFVSKSLMLLVCDSWSHLSGLILILSCRCHGGCSISFVLIAFELKRKNLKMADSSTLPLLLRCMDFAAMKHSRQRRKDVEQTPYINHPIGKWKNNCRS